MKWILPLLLICGCQRYNQWQHHRLNEKTTGSTRIIYKTRDQVSGLDLEFLKTGSDLTTYLQVHGQPIEGTGESNQARIRLISGAKVVTFLADFHEGMQRIRLSEVLQRELISLLKEGNPLTIELSGYRETIDPKRFEKVLKQLDEGSNHFLSKFKMSIMSIGLSEELL